MSSQQLKKCGLFIKAKAQVEKYFPNRLAVRKIIFIFAPVNIKQEFGKWFLDVAKYVLTALLLTSMIEGLSQTWVLVTTAAVSILCLTFGAILMRKGSDEEERRERNRQRHRDKVKKGGK